MPVKMDQEEFNEKILNLLIELSKDDMIIKNKIKDLKVERRYA